MALGKTPSKALKMLEIDYFEMFHPSGLNRQLNNSLFVELKIKELRSYIDGLQR